MKGELVNLRKQEQKMQKDMQKAQEELADIEVTAQSGSGMIQIVTAGRHDVNRVSFDDSLMGDYKDILEDLLTAAFNDAVRQVEKNSQEKMSGMTAGMNLPAGMKLPF